MEEIKTDVLVIGGGIAGMWAALKAREQVDSVCVVDKGFVGKTSHSSISAGIIIAVMPEDDMQLCIDDLIKAQDGLIDRAMAEFIIGNSYRRVRDMEEWGAEYLKIDGKYCRQLSRGSRHLHALCPTVQPEGIMRVVIQQAHNQDIKIINHIYIFDFLVNDGKVAGAIGVDIRNGELYVFNAKATVLTTNTTGFRGHYLACDLVGDGPMLAYHSGAELVNSEFNQCNTGPPLFHFEGTGPAAGFGAVFRNANGEAFMARYYPVEKDRADVSYLNKAMAIEVSEGRGPIYFDFSNVGADYWDKVWVHKKDLKIHKSHLVHWGIDMQKPEWLPAHQNNLGAIRTNFDGASNLPGLFAAGKCRGGIGIALMTGWSWCSCVGTGFLAGDAAARYARQVDYLNIDKRELEKCKDSFFTSITGIGFTTPENVLRKIQEIVFAYDVMILKHETRLQSALGRLLRIRDEEAPLMTANDIHGLVYLHETKNILLNAEMFLRASIMRTESRQGHYREDYPVRDDNNWLSYVAIRKISEENMNLRVEPLI